MYIVLTGAKKNVGDALITERSMALLAKLRPEHELVKQPSWKPLDLDLARTSKAIIILGGPGYQPGFAPRVYPLTPDLSKLPCPVVPLGLGWKGIPGDRATVESYKFSQRSLEALRHIATHHRWLGCRDEQSVEVLNRHGITNALMTGCPVWYHLPHLGAPMKLPEQVNRLVFTPAQRDLFRDQSLAVAKVLAEQFPKADRICAFHRGIRLDSKWMTAAEADNNQRIAHAVQELGFEVRDVSDGTDKLKFYDDADLHVGYRVHAHIYFLSKRLPSTLIHEDGRGRGASDALGVLGVDGFRRSLVGNVNARLQGKVRHLLARIRPEYEAAPSAASQVAQLVRGDVDSGFARFAGVGARIDAQFQVMERFIKALP